MFFLYDQIEILFAYDLPSSITTLHIKTIQPTKICDLHRDANRTLDTVVQHLLKWARDTMTDDSIKALEELKHKKRYAHSYKQMELINERRRKEREKNQADEVA